MEARPWGGEPTEIPIPDGHGNEGLEVIIEQHRIETGKPTIVDESTIQTERSNGREYNPCGDLLSSHFTLSFPMQNLRSVHRTTQGPGVTPRGLPRRPGAPGGPSQSRRSAP